MLAFCLTLMAGTVYGQQNMTQKVIKQEPSVKVERAKHNIQKTPVSTIEQPINIQKAPVPPKGQPVKAGAKQDLQVAVNSLAEKKSKVEQVKSESPKAAPGGRKR